MHNQSLSSAQSCFPLFKKQIPTVPAQKTKPAHSQALNLPAVQPRLPILSQQWQVVFKSPYPHSLCCLSSALLPQTDVLGVTGYVYSLRISIKLPAANRFHWPTHHLIPQKLCCFPKETTVRRRTSMTSLPEVCHALHLEFVFKTSFFICFLKSFHVYLEFFILLSPILLCSVVPILNRTIP